MSEAPLRALRGNVGFNTVDFFQLEGHYTDFNWLGNARRLDVQGGLGNLLAGPLNGHFIFRDVLTGTFGAFDEQAFLRPHIPGGRHGHPAVLRLAAQLTRAQESSPTGGARRACTSTRDTGPTCPSPATSAPRIPLTLCISTSRRA